MARVELAPSDDPRLEDYRGLREPRADRRLLAEGRMLVEGAHVVRRLLAARPELVRSVLLDARRVDALEDALAALDPAVPVLIGDGAALSDLVGFDFHRGILASARRPELLSPEALAAAGRDLIAAEAIANHDNLGGLFRSAAALGLGGVLLDPRSADPLYRRAIRVSIGTSLTLPWARAERWPEALLALKATGWTIAALATDGAIDLEDWTPPRGPVVLLVGTEGEGLSADALAAASLRLRIPMAGDVDSLNAATAATVAAWALRAGRRRAR
jgi:tRNA G18 (ribose-2'-O)-methylase SpoU